ncbi:hypothetical protein D3C76_637770 [compost metagenome]
MISEFALDQEFFSSNVLHDENLSVVHDFITRSWIDYGVLVLPKNGSADFLAFVETLPLKYRQRWLTAVEYGKKYELDRDWWEFSKYESFDELCAMSSHFKTAFASDGTCFVLSGGVECKVSCVNTGFEILGAGMCSESLNFGKSVELSRSDIWGYGSAEEIWINRFKSLAQFSKKIVIIDRYFFQNVWEAAQRRSTDNSMKNFFSFLSELGKTYHVKIISHGGAKDSDFHAGVYDYFYKSIARIPALNKALESWELSSVKEEFFQGESHDRLIGFDRHLCQIGNGMRVFGPAPHPRATFSAKYDYNNELSQRESISRKSVLWREIS